MSSRKTRYIGEEAMQIIQAYIFVFFYHFISLFGIIKSAIMNFDLLFQHEIKKNLSFEV